MVAAAAGPIAIASFERAASAMDLSMNYEAYQPAGGENLVRKTVAHEPFLVRQVAAALCDTLAALDHIGRAKEHLFMVAVIESPARGIKSRYRLAQGCMREALRYCQVLGVRRRLVDAVQAPAVSGFGRRSRETRRQAGTELGREVLAADDLLRKIVSAIGRDLSRVSGRGKVPRIERIPRG
jgi:hypothetical protein